MRQSTVFGTSEQPIDQTAESYALLAAVNESGPLAVAFSGGVDSAVVLAAGVRVWGAARTLAVIADSPALARSELHGARRTAAEIGVELLEVATAEWSVPGYRENAGNRCYFCKHTVLSRVLEVATERGFGAVATGTHRDDRRAAHRPGLRAAAELGVVEPLAAAGLGKAEVRGVAVRWGLSVADKPGSPCLSSRVAVGVPVTPARLGRVERAEELVRATLTAHGVPVDALRVRVLATAFRIELGPTTHHWLDRHPRVQAEVLRAVAAATRLRDGSVAAYRAGAVATASGPGGADAAPTPRRPADGRPATRGERPA
ncbi:ATP-dependent sacrificial sulfur transferase LarE [Streptomyces sp. HSW2009]|uniref:ATP-dependent sacrificial sulfur transferase LarE n=1 Tax=Streptomyces sp. HSW2009 TaxID=3142890 RepID=UPI0032EFD06B